MCFVSIKENRRMKPDEIVLRRRGEGEGEWWLGVNLSYIVSTYVKYHSVTPCTTIIIC
jgi:hypothetical protein